MALEVFCLWQEVEMGCWIKKLYGVLVVGLMWVVVPSVGAFPLQNTEYASYEDFQLEGAWPSLDIAALQRAAAEYELGDGDVVLGYFSKEDGALLAARTVSLEDQEHDFSREFPGEGPSLEEETVAEKVLDSFDQTLRAFENIEHKSEILSWASTGGFVGAFMAMLWSHAPWKAALKGGVIGAIVVGSAAFGFLGYGVDEAPLAPLGDTQTEEDSEADESELPLEPKPELQDNTPEESEDTPSMGGGSGVM